MAVRLHQARRVLAPLALVATFMCSPPPAAAFLDQGRPACDYCRMILGEAAFGGEVRLRSGAVRIYDAIECMAAAVLTDSLPQRDIRAILVIDHDAPHAKLAVGRATLVHCTSIESPMGQGFLAVRDAARARATCTTPAGTVLDWRGVLARVNQAWFGGKLAVEKHATAGVLPPKRTARR